jgi:hypothetical protein
MRQSNEREALVDSNSACSDDLAERIGRIATEDMLLFDASEKSQVAIGGFLAAGMTLNAVSDYFDSEEVAEFVDLLRSAVAKHEEHAA